ncbi:MAG: glycosyltransferase, partial [Actinomycetota bacterium]|nr:glycosyltransferase [Actinomycetota bacterium]
MALLPPDTSASGVPAGAVVEPFDPASTTLVVVTFNRSALLGRLLASVARMDPLPGRVVVVDNASDDDTTAVVGAIADSLPVEVVYHRMPTNTG